MIYLSHAGLRLRIEELTDAIDRPPAGVVIEDVEDSWPASLVVLSVDDVEGAEARLVLVRATYSSPPELALSHANGKEAIVCVGMNRNVVVASAKTLAVRRVLDLPTPFGGFLEEGDVLLALHEIGVGRLNVDKAKWDWLLSADVVTRTEIRGRWLSLDTMGGRHMVNLDTGDPLEEHETESQ